jgi:hypothetical protein
VGQTLWQFTLEKRDAISNDKFGSLVRVKNASGVERMLGAVS